MPGHVDVEVRVLLRVLQLAAQQARTRSSLISLFFFQPFQCPAGVIKSELHADHHPSRSPAGVQLELLGKQYHSGGEFCLTAEEEKELIIANVDPVKEGLSLLAGNSLYVSLLGS